jgi:beta-lactamase regulating signal transducer with metallopeptidase domain
LIKLVTPPVVLLSIPITAPESSKSAAHGIAPDGYAGAVITSVAAQSKDQMGLLLALWAIGTAAFFLLFVVRVCRFRNLLTYEYGPDQELVRSARRLSRAIGLRGCPKITCIPGRLSPMVWGFPARVVLPGPLMQQLSAEGRDALLAHELAHIRRRDHWVRLAVVLATGLFWWHPIVWLAARRIREAQELCCDALVVDLIPGGTAGYADTLLDVADFLAGAGKTAPAMGVGFGQAKSLRRRLTMIMKGTSKSRISSLGKIMILVVAMAVLPLAFSQSQEKKKTERERERYRTKLGLEIKQDILDSIHGINIHEIISEALQAIRSIHIDEINSNIQEALSEIEIDQIRGAIDISEEALGDIHIELDGLHDIFRDLKLEMKDMDVDMKDLDLELKDLELNLKDMELDIKEQIREALQDVKIRKTIKTKTKPPQIY